MDNVKYEIIDSNYGIIDNYNDYLNNEKLRNITDSILKLDLDNTTFRQAFDFLINIKGKLTIISYSNLSNKKETLPIEFLNYYIFLFNASAFKYFLKFF